MKDADITFIEQELNIKLPDSYRPALVPIRLRALEGNTDHQLWDDAKALVKLNQDLRAGSRYRPAWPPHMYAVGDPHGDELIAIDTRSPDGPVWWLDHGMIDNKGSYQSHAKFADWIEEYYRDLRSDMEGDGEDPDAKPKPPEPATAKRALRDLLTLFLTAVVGLLALLALRGIIHWFKH